MIEAVEHDALAPEAESRQAVTGKSRGAASRAWMHGVRAAYVAIVLVATLTNLEFSPQLAAAAHRLASAFSPALGWRDAIDGVRNMLLFAGLGAVWVLTSARQRIAEEIRPATVVGLLLSAAIEGLQTFSPVRDASIVDVLTDTVGACAGALAVLVAIEAIGRREHARPATLVPTILVAGAYVLAVVAEALTPLFASAPLNLDGGPLRRLSATWSLSASVAWSELPLSDVPLFLAAGFFGMVLALDRSERPYRAWCAVAALGMVVLLAHLAHGAAGLPIHREAILLDCVALGVGAWIALWRPGALLARWEHSDPRCAAIVGYAALLVLWGWRPFEPELGRAAILAELSPEHFIPLRAVAERVDLFSVAHTAQQFLLYVPLGALAAGRMSGSRCRQPELWAAVALPGVIELGHVVLAARTFDITNALLAWVGVAVGWRLVGLARAEAWRRRPVSAAPDPVWRADNNFSGAAGPGAAAGS